MDDLVTWYRACLDEDEQSAKAADVKQGDPNWWVSEVASAAGEHFTVRSRRDNRPIARVQRLDGDEGEPAGILHAGVVAFHIALHDPASVLADIAAKKAILDLHGPIWRDIGFNAADEDGTYDTEAEIEVCVICVPRHSWYSSREAVPTYPCATVRLLASACAARPGWQEAWRP